MGEVYRARDLKLDRPAALKILPAARSEEDAARFEREARAISALNHPNIATIYGLEQAEGIRFLALEFVPGGTLRAELARRKQRGELVQPLEAVRWCLQIARALAHAHRRGVIHRDVKTENVLISEDGSLKVSDFGLARIGVDSALTEEGAALGTPAYTAPEQLLGQKADKRADIFSFGAVAFEIATGELPFGALVEAALTYEILNAPTPLIATYRTDLPERFAVLIYECLEKKPEDRPQSLEESVELLEDLEAELRSGGSDGQETGPVRLRPQIDVGSTLGRYRVLSKIGEGGMGAVYRAQDLMLDRPVALKTLKRFSFIDPERAKRFLQEARAASALNHPNIVTIHEAGEADGVHFIAMEYVDGETLDERIGKGPMGVVEALRIAIQIAAALEAAHAAGIVHRDLKPGNVMIAEDGRVKLLDFGLAKLNEDVLTSSEADAAPRTEEGAILGTAAYMSPEQAEGRAIDSRSDVFSFGSALYEMTTGKRAFAGESKVSVLAAVVQKQPEPLTAAAPDAPKELERLVQRCLRKAPQRRWQHMGDVRVALEELLEDYEAGRLAKSAAAVPSEPSAAGAPAWGLIVGALAAGLAAGWFASPDVREAAPNGPTGREEIYPLTAEQGLAAGPSWSPDGEWIAYASDHDGSLDIWKKPIAGGREVRLTNGPPDEAAPAWSPDGRTIAYSVRGGGLFAIPSDGGRETRLTDFGANPRWSPDGRTVYFDSHGAIYRVEYAGGAPEVVVAGTSGVPHTAVAASGERIVYWDRTRRDVFTASAAGQNPQPLGLVATGEEAAGLTLAPNGRTLVYSKGAFGGDKDLWRVDLDPESGLTAGEPRRLTVSATDDVDCRFSADGERIAYTVRRLERQLWGVGLDRATGLASGESRVISMHGRRNYYPAASRDGSLILWTSQNAGLGSIFYREADGPESKLTPEWSRDVREIGASVSPDGFQIAYTSTAGGSYELWRMPSLSTVAIRLTQPGAGHSDAQPTWSPDGERLAFYSNRSDDWDIWAADAATGDGAEPLVDWPSTELYPVWSPDGRRVAFSSDRAGDPDIWALSLVDGETTPLVGGPGADLWSGWSPSGERFYFSSDRAGEFAIWMLPPDGGEPVRVTSNAYHLPENGLFSKFAVTETELIVPLETRRGDVYILEGFE